VHSNAMTPLEQHEAEIVFIVEWAEVADAGLGPYLREAPTDG
jgi:hypothetical protein